MVSLTEDIGWHEWLCHTNFSFLVGASHPSELVSMAYQQNYSSIAVTDFDGVYGLARSYRALTKLKREVPEARIRLRYGVEFHLIDDHDKPTILQDTLVLIAKSHVGYFNICKLSTYAHRNGKLNPNLPLEYLSGAELQDVVAIQPMRGLFYRRDGLSRLRKKLQFLKAIFCENLFLTASRLMNPAEDSAIPKSFKLARELGCKILPSQDVFFHAPDQKDLSDLLHAVRLNKDIRKCSSHLFINSERTLHSLKGLEARYRALPGYKKLLEDSAELSNACLFDLSELRYQYPKEMIPEGFTPMQYLISIVKEGASWRYRGCVPEKVWQMLKHELELISQLKFADYFLTVWDIVRWARAKEILCQGRGSSANSVVCFVLGITELDPRQFDLLFERFMSAERGDPPDIDVDFEHERREEVIQYIYERYGRPRAAMVANVITFQNRGALRACGKALGIPERFLDGASDAISTKAFRGAEADVILSELQGSFDTEDLAVAKCLPWVHWANMAERLSGFPRHLGIHSGGFVLADKPLDWLVAQEPATMEGRSVIQWCKDDIEALGFFKIDVLALGMLTALRKCFALVKDKYEAEFALATIPHDDQPTYHMIQKADTVGTFQIESRAQMSMLPRLKPKIFYDLVIEVAIIRPGPIQGKMIHPYLNRRDGKEPVTFPDPRLIPILKRTLGIPIFQEQVMRIAMAVGNFTPGEADELRKNLGAFSIRGKDCSWIDKLEQGMRSNGLDEKFIGEIMMQLEGFAHYGFPESHAASFALIAYASSFMKCHYPAPFFTSILNSQPMGFYSAHTLLQTAKLAGIEIRPICVNSSDWDSTLEASETKFRYAIRVGLRLVKGLRQEAADKLVKSRKNQGFFRNIEDMLKSTRLRRDDLTAIAAANALSIFGFDRRFAIWLTEAAPFCQFLEDSEDPIRFPKETRAETFKFDFQSTSTSLGDHPAKVIKEESWQYNLPVEKVITANLISRLLPQGGIFVFGMTTVRQAPPSANGMVFATIEDETGLINLALTPQVYQRFRKLFDHHSFLCVLGRLQKQGEAHSILVSQILEPIIREAEIFELARDTDGDIDQNFWEMEELLPTRNYF